MAKKQLFNLGKWEHDRRRFPKMKNFKVFIEDYDPEYGDFIGIGYTENNMVMGYEELIKGIKPLILAAPNMYNQLAKTIKMIDNVIENYPKYFPEDAIVSLLVCRSDIYELLRNTHKV